MINYQCQNPILLLVFKRLDTLIPILEQIKQVKPHKLYIDSDAGRNTQESRLVYKVRHFIETSITWECSITTLYREHNLGCKHSVSQAISWFFSLESQGIILEDDCLPSVSFFRFCDELLERYKDSQNIFMVSGWSGLDFAPNRSTDTLSPKAALQESYFFSKYNHIWGWASWARAWAHYQLEFEDFEREFQNLSFDTSQEKRAWHKIFKAYAQGRIDTWDYPWTHSIWKHNGLCIYPKENLVSNIGFNRADASHTTGDSKFATMPRYELCFPLKHPQSIERNITLDRLNFLITFSFAPLYKRALRKLIKLCKGAL